MNDSSAQTFNICEASALMAGVDPMDAQMEMDEKTLDLRIDAHPQASIKPESIEKLRDSFYFLLSVAVTLELKLRCYKDFDIEVYHERYMEKMYRAYLDKVKESTAPTIKERIFQYNLSRDFPFFLKKHLARFYKEKSITMEEAQSFQVLNLSIYHHICVNYDDIYFEESDIRAVTQKYNYNDKYFNPVPQKTKAKSVTPLKQTTLSAPADIKERYANETLVRLSNPFEGLGEKKHDYTQHMGCLLKYEKQYAAYSLRWEYELDIPEIAKRMGNTRQAVDGLLAKAKNKVDNQS